VKTAEIDFHFPVLGITPDKSIWAFPDRDVLTSCGPHTLRDNMQDGMELVDADGRRWMVESIQRTGRASSWLQWLIDRLISTPQSRIEHELTALDPVTLDEVKARVREAIETFPETYSDSNERESVLGEQIGNVMSAQKIADIPDILGLDSFMAY
jgi:hypothetical protein